MAAEFYGWDERNDVKRAVLHWRGPGYYAGYVGAGTWHLLCVSNDRSAPDIHKRAQRMGLSSPKWAQRPDEALYPYRIILAIA